jgi:hypothetical protein
MNRFGTRHNNDRPYSSRGRVKKNTNNSNKIDLTTEMFPELSSNIPTTSNISMTLNKPMSKSVWSPTEPVKDDADQDDLSLNNITNIDINDTRYWRGMCWTGPAIIRGNTRSSESVTESNRGRIEYSRDNIHWYSSWGETFSEAQIERRQLEKEQEKYEDMYRMMNEYSCRVEEESDRYYLEVGELDDYAKAVFARNEYEAYAKQFDLPEQIESVENNDYDEEYDNDYLEEDY